MDSRSELEKNLAGLPTLDADPERIERIRTRCLYALEAKYRQRPSLRTALSHWRRRLELAAAFSLSAVYLAAAVTSSLALLR